MVLRGQLTVSDSSSGKKLCGTVLGLFLLISAPASGADAIVLRATTDFEPVEDNRRFAPFYAETRSDDPAEHGLAVSTLKFQESPAAAQHTFAGPAGNYSVVLNAVSEEDGQSRYRVLINGNALGVRVAPLVAEKRIPNPLDFGVHALQPGDIITVTFWGHTTMIIPEHEAFAWSRGRWRALHLEPTTTPLTSTIEHVVRRSHWTFEHLDIPLEESVGQTREQAAARVDVVDPLGQSVTPLLVQSVNGAWSVRNPLYVEGDWHISIDNVLGVSNVAGGKPTGPLSRWSEVPQTIADGSDRPIAIQAAKTHRDLLLESDDQTLPIAIAPPLEASLNLLVFAEPLWSAEITQSWMRSDQTLDRAAVTTRFESLQPRLNLLGRRLLYLDFSAGIFPGGFLAGLSEEDRVWINQTAFDQLAPHWHVYAPVLYSANNYPFDLAGAHCALRMPLSLDSSDLPTLPSLDELVALEDTPEQLHKLTHLLASFYPPQRAPGSALVIARGSYPDLTADEAGHLHLVYAREGRVYYRNYAPGDLAASQEEFTGISYQGHNNDGPQRSDPDIRVDTKGRVHVLAGASYAIKENNQWRSVQTLFQRDTALTLDGEGNAFVCKRGGNHGGEIGFDKLPAGADVFHATASDPDIGTKNGEAWTVGGHHPYGHTFTAPDDTIYVVYRQGAPDYIAWRATQDHGKTWHGGGVYGRDRWQPEAPAGIAADTGDVFVAGPNGGIFLKPTSATTFHFLGDALNCGSRDLPTMALTSDSLMVTGHGGRYAVMKQGRFLPETKIPSPDGHPVGFVNLATMPDEDVYAFFETGDQLDKENKGQHPSGTATLWLRTLE